MSPEEGRQAWQASIELQWPHLALAVVDGGDIQRREQDELRVRLLDGEAHQLLQAVLQPGQPASPASAQGRAGRGFLLPQGSGHGQAEAKAAHPAGHRVHEHIKLVQAVEAGLRATGPNSSVSKNALKLH